MKGRPDFTEEGYKGENDYLVSLTEDGYNIWRVTGGFVWDDGLNNYRAHPELGRIIEVIKARAADDLKEVMDEHPDE